MSFRSGLMTACLFGMVPMAAEAETLSDALVLTEATNPQLDSGRADADIADENLAQARAAGRTTINITATAGGQATDSNRQIPPQFQGAVGAGFNAETGIATAAIEAARPIFTNGRVPAGIRSAKAGIEAADFTFDELRQSIFFDVVAAYMDVIRDTEAVSIRKNNVDVLAEQLRAAQDRFAVGVVTRTDVKLSEARLEGARANEAAAQAQLESSRATYAFLVGQRPEDLVTPGALSIPASLEAVNEIVFTSNPSLLAAKANERAAAEQVKVARGNGGLQVDIVGSANGQEVYQEDLKPERDTNLSAVARARIPLWQGWTGAQPDPRGQAAPGTGETPDPGH
ncbi:MAG: TolC family protein [Pseudomonadota bacterium]